MVARKKPPEMRRGRGPISAQGVLIFSMVNGDAVVRVMSDEGEVKEILDSMVEILAELVNARKENP